MFLSDTSEKYYLGLKLKIILLSDTSGKYYLGLKLKIIFLSDTSGKYCLGLKLKIMFRTTRVGIFPRSSLLGTGQVGFWEFGKGGSTG
jgi:hypothetical protein